VFAGNNPVNATDPYGLECVLMAMIETTYYSDGSSEQRVLGYFWAGDDCGPKGGRSRSGREKRQQKNLCTQMLGNASFRFIGEDAYQPCRAVRSGVVRAQGAGRMADPHSWRAVHRQVRASPAGN
jgi:hypothetical protein